MKKILNTILIGILLLPMIAKAEVYIEKFGFIGYDIGFDKNKTSYDLTVENNVKKLGIFNNAGEIKVEKTSILSNYLVIIEELEDVSEEAVEIKYKLNGNEIDVKKIKDDNLECIEYITRTESATTDCNYDSSECYRYIDKKLVYSSVDNKNGYYQTYYKDGEVIFISIINDNDNDIDVNMIGDLKEGTNTLEATIINEDEDSENYKAEKAYTFNITRKASDGKGVTGGKPSQEDKDELPPPTGNATYVVAIIMLVLSFGVGIYAYYKKSLDIK